MQVWPRTTSGATQQSDNFSGVDCLPLSNTGSCQVCISGFISVVMLHHDHIPIIALISGVCNPAFRGVVHRVSDPTFYGDARMHLTRSVGKRVSAVSEGGCYSAWMWDT